MDKDTFRNYLHEMADWMADYLEDIERFPVKPNINPGDIMASLPANPPKKGQDFTEIFDDFKQKILPGVTHWQHPGFHAYFPGNNSKPSILGEMATSAIGAQCMMWITSPAAAELEELMMSWLKQMLGLPATWEGVIQDTASTSTLCALLSAREKYTDGNVNENGYSKQPVFAVYCSSQAHSSIEKGVRIAGIGSRNLRMIPVDENFAMIPSKLEEAIKADLEHNIQPLCIVAALGTTGSTAIDPIEEIGIISNKFGIWLHIDAAFAGTALILPELRWMGKGLEYSDSFVFNPHKWMFTNFDCSAYFVKDKRQLIKTFSITPEYLRTDKDEVVNNYKDWGIQMGRRFRALKLWFVIRSFGVEGLKKRISEHIKMGAWFAKQVIESPDFELLAPVPLNTVCFRYNPGHIDQSALNEINEKLLEKVNQTGKIFVTHTKLKGNYTIRAVFGQTEIQWKHVESAWKLFCDKAAGLV